MELSPQTRFTWAAGTAVAVKFKGADGAGVGVGEGAGIGVAIGVAVGVAVSTAPTS